MNIKIKVTNQLTGRVEIDSQIEVTSTWGIASDNHETLRQFFPDCQVSFYMDNNSFIVAPPVNMERDEQAYADGLMSWKQYCNKWLNDDIVILERY